MLKKIYICMIYLLITFSFTISFVLFNEGNIINKLCIGMIIYVVIALPISVLLDIIYNYFTIKIKEKNNSSKIDIEYYRELLKEYPIPVLNACLTGLKCNYKDEMVATLISMTKDKKIEIKGEKIEEISNEFSLCEKNIIRSINGVQVYSKNLKRDWKQDVIIDAKKLGLIHENANNNLLFNITAYLFMLLIFICFIITFFGNVEGATLLVISLALIPYYVIMGSFLKSKIQFRTKKGMEIAVKLEGLRKYLLDYSKISERQIDEVLIWDDYLIYAILFNIKGNLDNEAKDYYIKFFSYLEKK